MPQPSTTGGALMGYPSTVDTGQVTPWIVEGISAIAGNGNAVLVANTVYLWAFKLNSPTTILGMRWRMAATATGKTDAGIYDSSGNLLANIGATVNTANLDQSVNFATALNLSPGKYYMALTPGNSTDTYGRAGGLVAGTITITRAMTATNNSTGTTTPVLPGTTGGTAASNLMPSLSAIIQGGL